METIGHSLENCNEDKENNYILYLKNFSMVPSDSVKSECENECKGST